MCFNYTTSMVSYLLGLFSGIFALYTNQIVLGVLILAYCQMQLSEAMIWKGIDTKNNELNKKGTLYGKYLLPSHNIAIAIGILILAYKNNKIKEIKQWLPLLLSFVFYLYVLDIYNKNKSEEYTYPYDKSCVVRECQNSKNRLVWPYNSEWYLHSFILSIILFLFFVDAKLNSRIFLLSTFIITFILTIVYQKPETVGSVWCFSAAILAPIIVLVNYFLIKD